jgi:hypothetical protein
MPKRYNRRRQLEARAVPIKHEYQITHPTHKPDLRGEFAGVKVYRRGGKQFVKLSPAQAKFYLDQGAIERVKVQVVEQGKSKTLAPSPSQHATSDH